MQTRFTVYAIGKPAETREVDWPADPGYDRLKALIEPLLDGQHLEHVTVLYQGRRADMFVDERGAVKGLPVNDAATTIYRANWLSQHPDEDPETLPEIHGPAVLFYRLVWL